MKTYFQFTDSRVVDAAKSKFWREQQANGQELTAFDSFSSGGGECNISNDGDHSAFEAFLKREGLNYTKSTQSIWR